MSKIIEAVYEGGVFKPLKKIKLKEKERVKILIILPKEKDEEEIIKKLRKLKKVDYPQKKLDRVYYGRYLA